MNDERPTVSIPDAERRERRWVATLIIAAALVVAGIVAEVPDWLSGIGAVAGVGCMTRVSAWHAYAAGRRAEVLDAHRRRRQGRL